MNKLLLVAPLFLALCFSSFAQEAKLFQKDTVIACYGDVKVTVCSEKSDKAPANEIDALNNVRVENPEGLSVDLHFLVCTTLSSIYNSNVKNTGEWKGMKVTRVQISKKTAVTKPEAPHQYPDENFNR